MGAYKPDYGGIEAMLCSFGMQAEMRRRAELVKSRAVVTAPVNVGSGHPGRYKAAFKVSSGVKRSSYGTAVNRGARTRRAYGRVTNYAPEARWVEYGTKNNPRRRILGRALDAAKG